MCSGLLVHGVGLLAHGVDVDTLGTSAGLERMHRIGRLLPATTAGTQEPGTGHEVLRWVTEEGDLGTATQGRVPECVVRTTGRKTIANPPTAMTGAAEAWGRLWKREAGDDTISCEWYEVQRPHDQRMSIPMISVDDVNTGVPRAKVLAGWIPPRISLDLEDLAPAHLYLRCILEAQEFVVKETVKAAANGKTGDG